jgi:hypothetical protein
MSLSGTCSQENSCLPYRVAVLGLQSKIIIEKWRERCQKTLIGVSGTFTRHFIYRLNLCYKPGTATRHNEHLLTFFHYAHAHRHDAGQLILAHVLL